MGKGCKEGLNLTGWESPYQVDKRMMKRSKESLSGAAVDRGILLAESLPGWISSLLSGSGSNGT